MPAVKILFIGGTGNISSVVSRVVVERGHELHLMNRGRSQPRAIPDGARVIAADVREPGVPEALRGASYDVVVDWIAFTPADVERDLHWFGGGELGAAGPLAEVGQLVFISSASAYQKPPAHPIITESTPLANPYWEYSRNKIACEERFMYAYRASGFPVTIVRPSYTYDTVVPVAVGHWGYTIVDRMRREQPIIVHGDGTSLWVMTHAEDFARAFVGLLGNPQALGHAFHITSDELLTWDQIYLAIGRAAGARPLLVHVPSEFIARHDPATGAGLLGDKSHSVIFDNTKIKRLVPGWAAEIPFSSGIRRTVAWFDADPSRRTVDAESNARIDAILAAYDAI
jgi:nucleoside-diphosphate-sugar epimerase